jgi:hypothetical protein
VRPRAVLTKCAMRTGSIPADAVEVLVWALT